VDYEGELAVVIKKPVWRVATKDALDFVLGYTCFNDVTARDLQNKDNQWTRAKGFDTFAAVGPWIETELDLKNVEIETYLNGKLKQRGSTRGLIYSVPEIINFISHVMTLLPGDIIATGTPSGVGPMYPGDTVEVKIKQIGTLRNFVVANGDKPS
jgi:2-keto-4-pentenoate hydratase/2-oxohepta-3-ene-1,7-dioic acid hydratase in catechol pathway